MLKKSILFKTLIFILVILSSTIYSCTLSDRSIKEGPFEINVMSFNMRYETQYSVPKNIHTWNKRLPGIVSTIKCYETDIIGSQELEPWQLNGLMRLLGSNWNYVGETRDKSSDERCAIIFRKDIFSYIEGETIWLSETPKVVASKHWDNILPRIVTYGLFKHNPSGEFFYFFNTHLDNKSSEAKSKGLELILSIADIHVENFPILISGDYNMTIDSTDFEALNKRRNTFTDSFSLFSDKFCTNNLTFHNFSENKEGSAIDFILFSSNKLNCISTDIIYDKCQNKYYLSDHYPVLSRFTLKETNTVT